jgi:hypothetical protein
MKSSLYHEYLGKFVQMDNQKYRQTIFKYISRNVEIDQIYTELENAFVTTSQSLLILVVGYEYRVTNQGKFNSN